MTKCPCPECGSHSGRWTNQHIKAEPDLCDSCYNIKEAERIDRYNEMRLQNAIEGLAVSGFTPEQIEALNEWVEAARNAVED